MTKRHHSRRQSREGRSTAIENFGMRMSKKAGRIRVTLSEVQVLNTSLSPGNHHSMILSQRAIPLLKELKPLHGWECVAD